MNVVGLLPTLDGPGSLALDIVTAILSDDRAVGLADNEGCDPASLVTNSILIC